MVISQELLEIRDSLLQKIRNDPAHSLSPFDRLELYKSFGQTNLGTFPRSINPDDPWNPSIADKALAFLAILTARS